jgi:natural product biosynthesis luciferase-like monooxygenase protein
MEFGLQNLFESPEGRKESDTIREQIDLMQAAEGIGFTTVWGAEHHFSEYGFLASNAVTLAAVAEKTKTLRLGSAIVVLPFNHPIRVAEEYAFVDNLSGGRLDFGVGRGYQPMEFKYFGVDQAKSRGMFREALEIVLQAWTQERVTYKGKFYEFNDVPVRPKPLQKPTPPLWMAVLSPESFALAGRLGANLEYAPVFTPNMAEYAVRLRDYYEALVKYGHDPATKKTSALRMIYLSDSREQARKDFEGPLLWYYRKIAQLVAPPPGQPAVKSYETYTPQRDLAAKVTFDDLVEGGAVICGTPDDCNEDLERFVGAYKFNHLMVWTRLGGLAPDKVLKSMRLMQEHVIPVWKDKTANVGVEVPDVEEIGELAKQATEHAPVVS